MTGLRLILRMRRFELSVYFTLMAVASLGWIAMAMLNERILAGNCFSETPDLATCLSLLGLYQATQPVLPLLMFATVAVPGLIGVIVGVSLVGLEIDRGTATLPWSLGLSRTRWLLRSVALLAVVLFVPALILGFAADEMFRIALDGFPLERSLQDYEVRGPLTAARAVSALGVGVLIGAIVGQTLPALISGAIAAAILIGGVAWVGDQWNQAEAIEDPGPGSLLYFNDNLFRGPDGTIVTSEEAGQLMPYDDPRFYETFQYIQHGQPGSRARIVVGRELAMHGLIAVAMVGASVLVVNRRRPY